MIKKRLFTILLSCCMVLTMLPTVAFAGEGGEGGQQCSCETACVTGQMNMDCPVCGEEDAVPEKCSQYVPESASMTIYIMLSDTEKLTLEDVKAEDTIGSIKAKIQSEKGYAVTLQKLFATLNEVKTELEDGYTLSYYAIPTDSTLTLEMLTEKPEGTFDLADGSIEITAGANGVHNVKQGVNTTSKTGAVTIMQSGSNTPTAKYSITVTAAAGQTANIILAGVNIDLSATGSYRKSPYSLGEAAMATYGGGNITVELDGINCLISGAFRAGLEKHNAGMLTINDSNVMPGSLRALGCFSGAGIGGIAGYFRDLQDERVSLANANAENITINGGTIEALPYFEGTNITPGATLGNGAGIGGGYGGNAKNITINGGKITASSGQGAGIGSGSGGQNKDGNVTQWTVFHAEADNITINGGEVTATAISGGAGIGGGLLCTGKNITINNGKVTATGNEGGAGIGGGYFQYEKVDSGNGNGENITITGGEVIASGGTYRDGSKTYYGSGAGIGGGGYRDGKNITITGGKVTATGGASIGNYSGGGAGIGGGGGSNDYGSCSGSDITITGGEIFAYGGEGMQNNYSNAYTGGAGIGGGGSYSYKTGETAGMGTDITISNATITAVGGPGGACIGGGGCKIEDAPAGNSDGKHITIENCTVNASSTTFGAGIGGGYGGGGYDITIKNGKKITATGRGGAGIGGGYGSGGYDITIENCKEVTTTSIGGGGYDYSISVRKVNGENITIKRSKVTANVNRNSCAGIGGGEHGDGKNILIQDSEVVVNSPGGYGAGIGGGKNGNGEDITIESSKVAVDKDVSLRSCGAGIGGGGVELNYSYDDYGEAYGIGHCITIQNSEIIATARCGAGIGGGAVDCSRNMTITPDASLGWGNGEDITIINSSVTATSEEGAGIGGGVSVYNIGARSRFDGKGRKITIESGTVIAKSNNGGAGIGGGIGGDAENITINGGNVTATASNNESYSRGGAGIGGGSSSYGGNAKGITINGGTVIATGGGRRVSGDGYAIYVGGAGIGGGGSASYGGGDAEDITINGGTVITTGGPNAAGIGGGASSARPDYSAHRDYPVFSEEDEGTWIPRLRSGCAKNITITGGTITAIGQDKASGIGGGGFHTQYDEDNQFGEHKDYGSNNPQRAAGCAENITITGGYITVQGGEYGAGIGRSEFNFKGRVSTESGLIVTGGTFYRSIPANVEVRGHVVQYQTGKTASAWQVVQDKKLAYLPRLIDENGVSLDEWYCENEKYEFATPVAANLTLMSQAHTYGDWTVTKEPTAVRVGEKQRTCTDCGYVQTAELPTLETPGHVCVYDREKVTDDALKSAADCTRDAVYYKSCACGVLSSTETFTEEDTMLGHDWAADWCHDTKQHWHECTRCHTQRQRASHTGGPPCVDCGYNRNLEHAHALGTSVAAKAATCTEAGNRAYYICSGCDGWFEDEACTMQISKKLDVFLAPTGHKAAERWQTGETTHWKTCVCGLVMDHAAHTTSDWIIDTKPTATTDGTKHKECTICKTTLEQATIPATGGDSSGGGSTGGGSSGGGTAVPVQPIDPSKPGTDPAEPAEDTAANIAKGKAITADLNLVARSSKTSKKNIKVVLKEDAKTKASIKELQDLGFTVKYRFYRSTKKTAGYKAAVTKKTATYTNTSGKKGTKYYYKIQIRVYDEKGKLIAKTALKQCKYASRTWSK